MRPLRRRRRANRTPRFESVEPRLFLSGDPVADFCLDYFVDNQLYDEVYTMLLDAHNLTGLSQARADYGFTGGGQTVAVIDTGIAYDHIALGGGLGASYRVVGGFDFTGEGDADPYDDGPMGSHGTHVAGIIASSDSSSPGVAPDVDLVGLRVFDDDGRGYFSWVEEALQWVHANGNAFENPITAVNLSLGTDWNSRTIPGWATLEDEFAQLEADGIFIAVAAGNAFSTYQEAGLSYPAVSPHVVPVASVDDGGNLSFFSQRDQRVIAAPGRGVLSTVPDYVGNQNGVNDDFARYSGTSMASPYVAGASVLLRQAYEFVGLGDVTQDVLYSLMFSTADIIHDASTGQDYHRLNLARAIDAIMPEDDFGSSPATAHQMGTLSDAYSLSGTIGSLRDDDWFSFTAGATGTVTIEFSSSDGMPPHWQFAGVAGEQQGADGTMSFDVLAGQTYAVALTGDGGLGHYTLGFELEAAIVYTDWGAILQDCFAGNQIDAAGRWYAMTAGAGGVLTVEAFFSHAAGDVDLQLFDGQGRLVGSSAGMTNTERINVTAAAGETFYLHAYTYAGGANGQVDFRVTNLVSESGGTVRVQGTAGDDIFSFAAGTTHQVAINGVAYRFASACVTLVTFDGLAGSDTVVLTGTAGDDNALLRPGSAELSGSGYCVQATSVETATVLGMAGADQVVLFDSAGDDTFAAAVGYGGMFGPGFSNQAVGFERVEARATAGGRDTAKLYDSAGDDVFVATPGSAVMSGGGFHNQAGYFEVVHAFATAGGFDTAKFYDSVGDDSFAATPMEAVLYGRGFFSRGKFFEQVCAYGTAGGNDRALFVDSAGDDTFVAAVGYGGMFGPGFSNEATGFERIEARATSGGMDTARLYDSAGDDVFVATAAYAALSGQGFHNRAERFEVVHAFATAGGLDTAKFYDSVGDDSFAATPIEAVLSGQGFSNRAKSFEQVHAFATAGGHDVARLFDSPGDDVFLGTSIEAALFGQGFYNRAKYFEEVYADGTAGGSDQARLCDSAGDDRLQATAGWVSLRDDESCTWVYGFEFVRAEACNGGTNKSELAAVDYVLRLDGYWN